MIQIQQMTEKTCCAVLRPYERVALLDEVNFKWLLSGLGWWIDTSRLHKDSTYAAHFIEIAECSDCDALRDCAAALKHQLDSTCNCHWAETGRLEAATQAS